MSYSDRLTGKLKLQKEAPPVSSDKQAYISYLEVQLDRAAKSAGTVQTYLDRFDEVQSQVSAFEEKLLNLTRLLKLQQTYVESQEEELTTMKDKFEQLSGFVESTSSRLAEFDPVREALPLLPRIPAFEGRLAQLEEKLQAGLILSDNQEAKRLANCEAFVSAVDSSLKDEEAKLNVEATQAALKRTVEMIEDKEKAFHVKVETALDQHARSIAAEVRKLESKCHEGESRPKSPARTDAFATLSQRLQVRSRQDIEGEMNSLRDSSRKDSDLKAIGEAAWNAEQTCNRLAEDTLDRLSRMDQRIGELARTRSEGGSEELETRLHRRIDQMAEKTSDLMKKYLETQRTLQTQMKDFGVAVKRLELLDTHSTHKVHQSLPPREEDAVSPRFPAEDQPKRSTSVPHMRKPAKSPKARSASSSNTPPLKSPASPLHPSTAKSRAMDASIKKKLKDLKSKEKAEQSFTKQSPEVKQKRHRKLEARRNDRLDQLYKEYTAKYQSAQS